MPSFKDTKILPYKSSEIYGLVMDIEKYPEFLPWCKQAKIINIISTENLQADLLINFKSLFEKYRSDVKHGIGENGFYFVDVTAIEGPFKYLKNRWRFRDLDNQKSCKVEFEIEFQFNSFLLEKMFGAIFEKAVNKMMHAFEERAKVIFAQEK
ncbi:MAG: type II toxin-antitoxin system RatA family toxin [Pelagibacterales bacterium]|nr:type II toxin-antitoxin system RatA family toxin [Pelagibacterales bacterium]